MFTPPTDNAGRTRLLPASVPFRFFFAASGFQLAAWLLIALGRGLPDDFSGGPGPGVAALHLFTLGTLTMTAIGASLQLLPVATVQSVRAPGLAVTGWWLLVPGVAVLATGMAIRDPVVAIAGALPVVVALALHALLLAVLLAGAKRQRAMTWHAWIALACLTGVILSGSALVLHYRLGWLVDARGAALLHLVLAGYGFMGLLATGFSYLLVPMFVVAKGPGEAVQRSLLGSMAAALLAAVGLLLGGAPRDWLALPAAAGLAAAGVHVWLLMRTLARRRSREGPWTRLLMQAAWAALLASLALGAALAAGLAPPASGAALVVLLVPGWLLSFELAMLMRILPFLSAVHAKIRGGRMPAPATLVAPALAWLVAGLHLAAVVVLLAGVVAREPALVRTAAALGAAGAAALLAFHGLVWWRAGRAGGDSLTADKVRRAARE